ncbi:hypothetical protein BCON_0051g00240 [Botryotinia convoluta]|uniref:Uncharacterized protein n=1 Tax=Botryotinia convoluta TaxID=54673 RepID=A0A4Z1IDR4_9HELO|nr:hypothetical protein BCON_0051g00240 [Botryotinia convoluta]
MAIQDASMTSRHQSASTVPEKYQILYYHTTSLAPRHVLACFYREMYAAPQVMSKKSAALAGNHRRFSCKSSELKVWKGGVSRPDRQGTLATNHPVVG